jgi:UDP-N-acetylglucosamine 2-epimerase (non-hydrolysing)
MKLVSAVGARPNFMKIAPVIQAIDKRNSASSGELIEHVLVHTGQHAKWEIQVLDSEAAY